MSTTTVGPSCPVPPWIAPCPPPPKPEPLAFMPPDDYEPVEPYAPPMSAFLTEDHPTIILNRLTEAEEL